jgi:hypothetical protein
VSERLTIASITVERANEYIARWHRHNKPRLAKFAVSVVDPDGNVHGVALVGRPVAPALDDGQAAEILRDRMAVPSIREVSPDHDKIALDEKWRSFFFWGYGVRVQSNCARCPATASGR